MRFKTPLITLCLICQTFNFIYVYAEKVMTIDFSEMFQYTGMLCDQPEMSNVQRMKIYKEYLKQLNICLNDPDGFIMTEQECEGPCNTFFFVPNESFHSNYFRTPLIGTSICLPPYKSSDGNAILLYPIIGFGSPVFPDYQIEAELIASNANDQLDCSNLIKYINECDLENVTNAQKVEIYEFNIVKPIDKEFQHCVGIALRKKDNYTIMMKLVLNDNGINNKDSYIKSAIRSVKYGEHPTFECIELEKKVSSEGIYPKKKWTFTGIIMDE